MELENPEEFRQGGTPRVRLATVSMFTSFGYLLDTNAYDLSLVVRKAAFCICKNKDADQLRGYREADQRLCFRYMDSTIPLLSESGISSL